MKGNKTFFSGVAVGIASLLMINVFISYLSPIGLSSRRVYARKTQTILRVIDQHFMGEYEVSDLKESMFFGLVYGLGDPYTIYLNAPSFEAFMEQSSGVFAGIGIQVSVDPIDNKLTIITPFANSPAELAGLLPRDKIIKIDGKLVFGDNLSEAISMIQGEVGTSVSLTIFRESTNETFDVDIIRENIEHPTVIYRMLEDNIGYIRITTFESVTASQFKIALEELTSLGMDGLVIDLRNNPGGLLHSVAQITDLLVPPGGNIVFTENKQGNIFEIPSKSDHIDIPLVILVNGNSASASEVLAGAVKDYEVGTIVGTTTFGKGIVQSIIDLGDGTAIKLTTAKYFTPNGTSIHGSGITPDYIVEMENHLSVRINNLTLEEDVQLYKAIQVINAKLN
jgi:carboxyl-terminal processing protease